MSPGRIALGYAVIAILWIAFSDAAATHFRLPPVVMTMKGTLFVLVTASLLYFTIRRSVQALQLTAQELRQSKWYLAEAQKLSHTGSWVLDVVHNRLSWSDEVFRIFGIQFGTPLDYETFLQAVHTEDRAFVDQAWKKALLGAAYDIEHRILVGREVRWVREKAQLEFDVDGRAINGMGTVQDITERKRAEEALRERADLLNLTHDTVFVMDLNGVIKYWNRGAEERYGWSAEQAVGKVVHNMLNTAFSSSFEEIKAEVTGTGRWEGELRHTRKDGTQLVVASRWSLERDHHGVPLAILETNNDITDRKRSEQALRESETRFRTFADHAGDALFVVDAEQGTIVDVNLQACKSLGYTQQELIGISPPAFHLDSDRLTMKMAAERASAGEAVVDIHYHRRKDGSTFPVEANTSSFWYGGRLFLLHVSRDISERFRAEEQRNKLRQLEADLAHIDRVSMMGELTASISHELNQPIAASIMNASLALQWLERDPPDLTEARLRATRIIEAGTLASEIIDRLRSLYKKEPPKRESLPVNEVIGEMVRLLRGEATRHAASVRMDLLPGLPIVLADRVQIQQVLMNLMLNGIEAMSDTGGVLTVKSQLTENGQIEISVNDTGPGLPPGKAGQIFDAFFTTKPQGSGMGLAISRSIVESHGGRIWANANGGCGATFHFTLPAAPSEADLPTDAPCLVTSGN